MRHWTEDGYLVTRRMYERQLDKVFNSPSGVRIMTHARTVGLVAVGKQGTYSDRPLTARERAALILMAALVTGTNLTLIEAARLVSKRQDWIRSAQAHAATGTDLVIDHDVAGALKVHVTVKNAVLIDPIIGVAPAATLEVAA
jgi:hypothetical protein